MKQWDKIWNVTFDRFKEATIDKIEFKEYEKAIKWDNKFEVKHIRTVEWNNIFIDSYYHGFDHTRFFTKEEAEKERIRLIKFQEEQIEKYKRNISKLTQ